MALILGVILFAVIYFFIQSIAPEFSGCLGCFGALALTSLIMFVLYGLFMVVA